MKTNQLKVGAALSYISMGLGYIISIIYTPIMLRLLGQSEYGLYNLVASVVGYLGLFNFGFGSAYVRYYSRYKVNSDEKNIAKLNGMFLIIFAIIGLVSLLAGSVLVYNIKLVFGEKLTVSELSTAKTLMAIMVFNIALTFPASVFDSYVTANEKYIFQKVMQMVKTIVNPFIMLPVLLMGYKSVGIVIVTTLLTILVELGNVIYCFKKLQIRFSFRKFDFYLMKEMTIFSSYIFLNMIIDQINWNVDKFIIGRFRGSIGVAIYGLAAQLNTYYLSLSTAISSVFIPRINRMVITHDNNSELTELFTRIGRIQFILLSLICSVLVFLGKPFIVKWAGIDYKEAYPIALLLIIPVTIPLIQSIGIEIQKAKNMHKFRSLIYMLIALGNVVLSIPLTKVYGGFGSALGTAISLLIGNGLVMNLYYHKKVGLNMRYFWRQIFKFIPALVAPMVVGILMLSFIDLYKTLFFLICGILYIMIYCISMWFLGMNGYEKDLIRKPIMKILKR